MHFGVVSTYKPCKVLYQKCFLPPATEDKKNVLKRTLIFEIGTANGVCAHSMYVSLGKVTDKMTFQPQSHLFCLFFLLRMGRIEA